MGSTRFMLGVIFAASISIANAQGDDGPWLIVNDEAVDWIENGSAEFPLPQDIESPNTAADSTDETESAIQQKNTSAKILRLLQPASQRTEQLPDGTYRQGPAGEQYFPPHPPVIPLNLKKLVYSGCWGTFHLVGGTGTAWYAFRDCRYLANLTFVNHDKYYLYYAPAAGDPFISRWAFPKCPSGCGWKVYRRTREGWDLYEVAYRESPK